MLQWGRNFLVTEMRAKGFGILQGCRLQWGRNFLVTEIRDWHAVMEIGGIGFNGAVTFWLRKFMEMLDNSKYDVSFNGAVTFWLRKSKLMVLQSGFLGSLQWGRNFLVTEMAQSSAIVPTDLCASMGP